MVKPMLIENQVYHERLKPFNHRFIYSIFMIKFSLDEMKSLKRSVFSLNRFNLFSFFESDYLDGSTRPLKERITELLRSEGMKVEGDIVLQTIPRMLGYGFNPVSFWNIYYQDGSLEGIMAEVNNTFGDRHYYLLQGFESYKNITTKKVFHVSPFFEIKGEYQFTFNPKSVLINYYDPDEQNYFFKSSLAEKSMRDFTTFNLLKIFLKFPLMTFIIMGRIHWQALKLFLKKAQYVPRTKPFASKLSKEVKS